MIEGIIYCKEKVLKTEFIKYFSENEVVKVTLISDEKEIENSNALNSAWFFIYAADLGVDISNIHNIQKKYPQIFFYYYYPTLNLNQNQLSDISFFNYIVIGENRIKNLKNIFKQMIHSYWKKIPEEILGISYDDLSPRLKNILSYIETKEMKQCSTAKLSEYLNISQGYFSQEFKNETGKTFREFMQKLLSHYEKIIFEQLDLTAKQASVLLGYSELSSFSRSFKKRKGYPPSMQRKSKIPSFIPH